MRSNYSGRSKPAASQQHAGFYRGTFDTNGLAEAPDTTNAGVKQTAGKTPATPVDGNSAGAASPEAGASAAAGVEEQLYAAEKSLLDKLQDTFATFGPLEEAVKVKLPTTDRYIYVNGCLLMRKSSFCREALTKNVTKGGAKELTLPAGSVSVLAPFLTWVCYDDVLPAYAGMCPYLAYDLMRWPDLVKLWIFARKMGAPKLQNHAVDVLVRKIHCSVGLFGPRKRTVGEIIQIRTVLNLLWYDKHETQHEQTELETLQPLRTLMMDFVVNPLYQTEVDAEKLLIGGVPDGFYKEHTFYTIQKNFNRGNGGLDNERDLRARMKMMVGVKPDTSGRLWAIDPTKYHVDNVTSAASFRLN